MDHRFTGGDGDRKAIRRALATDKVEFIQIAGGSGGIASIDDTVRCSEHAHVALSVALQKHHAKRILLTNHTECGAYAMAGHSFQTAEKEREYHVSELKKARDRVKTWYPDMEVLAGFMTVDDADQPTVEIVG